MLHSRLICFLCTLMLLLSALPANAETSLQDAMNAEFERYGEFYTWSFEKKADFYNTYVYHGVGTRRGVPCSHVLQKDLILESAKQYLLTEIGLTEETLATYLVDVDYWVDVLPDEDMEHEYYSVLYFTETAPRQYLTKYQMMIPPYNGEVLEFLDLDDHR